MEVPENAEVDTISHRSGSILMIMKHSTADGVTFTVYPADERRVEESIEAQLKPYKEEQLGAWPDSTFTDVEMEIFGQTAQGIERDSTESPEGSRKLVMPFPEQGRFVTVEINIWPPRNQAFVDGILASAKYDPNAPWQDDETPDESNDGGE